MQRNYAAPGLRGDGILAIDPTTGQCTVLIEQTTLTDDPLDADIDVDNGRVLILSTGVSRLILMYDLGLNDLTRFFFETNTNQH